MRVVRTDIADCDLLQIYRYIADHNTAAADGLVHEIDRRLQQVARFPFMGRARPRLGAGVRSVLVGSYVVFYLVRDDAVVVLRIIHGNRDIDREFER
jgi:toxin ParE1/3/4